MKILLLNWEYNWGSTGHIVHNLYSELLLTNHTPIVAVGIDLGNPKSRVFQFSNKLERYLFQVLKRFGGKEFGGGFFSTWSLIHFIKKNKPDIVHLHLLNFNVCNMYYLLLWLGKNHYKTVITHHAELFYTGTCGYAFDCNQWINRQCLNCQEETYEYANAHRNYIALKKAILSFDNRNIIHVAVSPWIKQRFLLSPLSNEYRINVVFNGIDISIFKHHPKIFNEPYILHVSSCFDPIDKNNVKGGYYVVEIAKRMPEIMFYIVAIDNNNLKNVKLPSNIKLLGEIQNKKKLSILYSNAAITLLTSRKESFSMIVAESLCCGTPLVGFEAGGPESIAIMNYCTFVPNGDVISLEKAIRKMLEMKFDREKISKESHALYSQRLTAQKYIETYYELLRS